MDDQMRHCKQIDETFNRIFGRRDESESVPVSLLRTATKTIVSVYPDNDHRSKAVARILDAAGHLKKSARESSAR